jgi:futalosine hydrolase
LQFPLHDERVSGNIWDTPIVKTLICIATALEGASLRDRIGPSRDVRIIETGVGLVNASHAATVAILSERPDAIIICGIGGAYQSSGLAVGDVACAELEIYGDLGAQSPSGFLDMSALGFPVVAGATPLFNELPLQIFPTPRRARFVTVSTCTGTDTVAREIERRTRGAVENMEGAAIVHVAHLHDIHVGEIRGVSNMVANRDKASWRLREATSAAHQALIMWLTNASPACVTPKVS